MKRILFATLFFVTAVLIALEWDFRDGDLHGFRPNYFISYEVVPGVGFTGTGQVNANIFTPLPLDISAEDYNFLEVNLDSEEALFVVYFSYDGNPMSESTRYNAPISPKQKRILIDLRTNRYWRGVINAIRFDVVRAEGHKTTVRSIRLLKEAPEVAETGLVANGDFSEGTDCWTGNATFSANGAILPPASLLISDPIEMPVIGAHLWAVKADKPLETTVEYLDILGNSLEAEPASLDTMAIVRPPRQAAFARLSFRNTSDSDACIKLVSFDPVPPGFTLEEAAHYKNRGKKLMDIPGFDGVFRGKWLWLESLGEADNQTAIFKKELQIDDISALAHVKLHVTADNDYQAEVNGHPLQGFSHDNWSYADSFLIQDLLKTGKNTITLTCHNIDGLGGILADIVFTYKDGTVTLTPSDESWLGKSIDDDTFQHPTIAKANGSSPWGAIRHGEPSSITAQMEGLDIPEAVNETTTWNPEIILHLGESTVQNDNVEFSIRLKNEHADYLLLGTCIPMGELEGKETYKLNLAPASFQFIPDGDYQVVISMTDTTLEYLPPKDIRVQRTANASRGLSTAKLVNLESIPQIELNGMEKSTLTQYLVDLGVSDKHYREMKAAFDSGIPALWIHHMVEFDENGNPDFTNIDNMCTTVLARNPNLQLALITRLDCVGNPTMIPFFDKNPDALARNYEGEGAVRNYSDAKQKSPSFASEKWLAECDRILTLLVEHLKEMPYGQRVSVILPSAGITWEWMYWGSQREGEFLDYSIAFREAFVRFAKEKYGTIENANLAWNKEFNSFEEIVTQNLLPTPQERKDNGSTLNLRLPAQSQYVMDFNRCMAVVTSDAIIRFCKTIKETSEGKLLTGAYYGYYKEIVHSRWAQHSGHYALSRVLASPYIDILHAPSSYNDRAPGGSGGIMIPDSSAHLSKKVFVTESDIRTLYSGQANVGMCDSLSTSAAVLIREAAMSFSHNVAMRYYDFSRGWVFGDPRLTQLAGEIRKAEEKLLAECPKLDDTANAIAFVLNENAMEQISYSSRLNINGVSFQYLQLPRSGVNFDVYMTPGLRDIPLDHKLWFFPNAFKLSDEDYQYIREKILVPGNTVVFAVGVDVLEQDHFATNHLTQLTGMNFRIQDEKPIVTHPLPQLNAQGKLILQATDISYAPPCDPFLPLFIPQDDGKTTILATDAEGTPLMAENVLNGCRIIFTAIPGLKAEWLRNLAVNAGIHCYNLKNDDITWASGNFMGFHFPTAGARTIFTPQQKCIVQDLIYGTEYKVENGSFQYDTKPMSSVLFLIKE